MPIENYFKTLTMLNTLTAVASLAAATLFYRPAPDSLNTLHCLPSDLCVFRVFIFSPKFITRRNKIKK